MRLAIMMVLFATLCGQAAGDGTCSGGTLVNGTSFHGGVGMGNAKTAAECCAACAAKEKCTIWTLSPSGCYLRPNDAGRHPFPNPSAQSGYTSAHVPVKPEPNPPPPPPAPPPHYPPVPPPTPPPNPCKTCKGPTWSWDTFPAFFHSADVGGPGGGFTEAALKTMTKFPMVTMEKWQGATVKPYMYEEEAWLVGAKQIKAINPNITIVVWLDSFRIYTDDRRLNPDLGSACKTGHFRPAQFLESGGAMDGKFDPSSVYLLKNESGLPALESWSKCHIFDHSKEIARNYWRDMCLEMTGSGVIDGCGADASWQDGLEQAKGWKLNQSTAKAWSDGHKAMMKMTTAALGDGVLLGKDPYEVGDYVNGALHEGCSNSNETVLTLRNLTRVAKAQGRRLVYQCHGKGKLDEVAAFLAGAGEYHYYGFGGWNGVGSHGNFSGHWMDGVFGRKLGAPLADAMYDSSTDTWTRSFVSGTEVQFNAKTNKGSISWGD